MKSLKSKERLKIVSRKDGVGKTIFYLSAVLLTISFVASHTYTVVTRMGNPPHFFSIYLSFSSSLPGVEEPLRLEFTNPILYTEEK
jgi:hypothetical protein